VDGTGSSAGGGAARGVVAGWARLRPSPLLADAAAGGR
jgi:hypothetical protein